MSIISARFKSRCSSCGKRIKVSDHVWWEEGHLVVCPECHANGREGKKQTIETELFKQDRKHAKWLKSSLNTTAEWSPMKAQADSKRVEPSLHPVVKFPGE